MPKPKRSNKAKSIAVLKALGWHPVEMTDRVHSYGWYRLADHEGFWDPMAAPYPEAHLVWEDAPDLSYDINFFVLWDLVGLLCKRSWLFRLRINAFWAFRFPCDKRLREVAQETLDLMYNELK